MAGGGYRAVVVESQLDYTPATGRGDTRMEAIADLNSKIWAQYLNADDAEDYRNGEDAR
jgi:hypothetical protein